MIAEIERYFREFRQISLIKQFCSDTIRFSTSPEFINYLEKNTSEERRVSEWLTCREFRVMDEYRQTFCYGVYTHTEESTFIEFKLSSEIGILDYSGKSGILFFDMGEMFFYNCGGLYDVKGDKEIILQRMNKMTRIMNYFKSNIEFGLYTQIR